MHESNYLDLNSGRMVGSILYLSLAEVKTVLEPAGHAADAVEVLRDFLQVLLGLREPIAWKCGAVA